MNRIQNLRVWLSALALAAGAGCVTSSGDTRLLVDNVSQADVVNIQVTAPGFRPYDLPRIAAKSSSDAWKVKTLLPRELTLNWVDEGKAYSKKFKMEKALKKRFKGRVLFQIENEGVARMFVMPDPDNKGSDLPWNVPEAWQGAPSIPGLSQ